MEPIFKIRDTSEGRMTAWEGYLTIQYVSKWKEKLISLSVTPGNRITIDLNKIHRIDTAGIQLLIFTKKFFLEKQVSVHFVNHSLPVLKAYDLLGLVSFFGDKIKVLKDNSSELEFSYGTRREPNGSV